MEAGDGGEADEIFEPRAELLSLHFCILRARISKRVKKNDNTSRRKQCIAEEAAS